MAQLFSNNAGSEVSGSLPVSGTTVTLAAGTGSRFPAPTGGDFFLGTLYEKDLSGNEINIEIVKVTNRVSDTLTIERDFENMTGNAGGYGYPTGAGTTVFFELRWTAYAAANAEQAANKDATGGYPGLTLFKLNLKNALGTVTSWFTTAATVARTWTMPDKDGTVAMLSDITGTNSGTNTGDQTNITGNAATVTTNANLTGEVTSVGNATTVTNAAVIGKVLTGYSSGAGTVAATDTILAAINKLNGNTATKANLTANTFTGLQTFSAGITETVYALTGTTPAFLESNGSVQTWTLSGVSTPTDSLTAGQSILLSITPGAYPVTWPAGTVWTKVGGSGAAPALFTAGKTNVLLWKVASTLYCTHLGDTL